MTTAELLNDWMFNYERERIKAQTYSRYQGLIDLHILPVLGEMEIETITRRQLHDFLARKKHDGNLRFDGGLSATSVNLILSILNMAFEYACDLDMLEANPCDRLKRTPDDSRRKVEAFTKDEQRKLEQTIRNEDDGRQSQLFGIVLCLYTGLRIGELLGLEWSDFDENCTVLSVTKTVYRNRDGEGIWKLCIDDPKTVSSIRKIPLPYFISEQLMQLRRQTGSKYVVCNKKGGRMSTRSYQYIFEKLTKKQEYEN